MSRVLTLIIGVVLVAGVASAQDEDYELIMTNGEGPWGGQATMQILLTNNGDDVKGYQWGACHDESLDILDGSVADGDGIDGIGFSFKAYSFFAGEGYTAGALLDVIAGDTIGQVTDAVLAEATYECPEEPDEEEPILKYPVDFCDTLGTPAVVTAVITEVDNTPVVTNGQVCIVDPRPFLFTAPEIDLEYRPDIFPIDDIVVEITILEDPEAHADYPQDTQGFSMGVGHDGLVVLPTEVNPIGPLPNLNSGEGPEFFGVQIDEDNGITVGCVYVALSSDTILYEEETAVVEITYEVLEDAIFENELGNRTDLWFRDDLGDPAVVNRVSVAGFGQGVTVTDGGIDFIAILQTPFVRGDCNSDEKVDMADGIFLLDLLFNDLGLTFECENACNFNGLEEGVEGVLLALADAVHLFEWMFTAGPPLPGPYPDCDISSLSFEEDRCELFTPCE